MTCRLPIAGCPFPHEADRPLEEAGTSQRPAASRYFSIAGCRLFLFSSGILAVLVLSGCAAHRLDWIQVGPQFPPRNYRDVPVYKTKTGPGRAWGAIGIIHGWHTPASNRREIRLQIKKARKLAASHGADAIIMAEAPVTESIVPAQMFAGGFSPPMIYLTGMAIRYVVETSTEAPTLPGGATPGGGNR